MTDTGQVPGEGQPESAGMVEQPGVPAHGAYTYLSEAPAEDEDLLLPGAQGAWGNEVPPPAPEPVVEAVHEPGPHETSGRDSGSVDLSGVRLPSPGPASVPPSPILSAPHDPTAAPQPARRPLHLGPPIPDASASPVRSLADRGPADAPVRQPGPPATGPEYLDVQPLREMTPQSAAPWGPAPAQVAAQAPAAETVGPAEPADAAQAAVARLTSQAAAHAQPADLVQPQVVHGHDGVQPAHGHDGVYSAPTVTGAAAEDARAGADTGAAEDMQAGADAAGVSPAEPGPVGVQAPGAQGAESPGVQGGEGSAAPVAQGGEGAEIPVGQGAEGVPLPAGAEGVEGGPAAAVAGAAGAEAPAMQGGEGAEVPAGQGAEGLRAAAVASAAGVETPVAHGVEGAEIPAGQGAEGDAAPPVLGPEGAQVPTGQVGEGAPGPVPVADPAPGTDGVVTDGASVAGAAPVEQAAQAADTAAPAAGGVAPGSAPAEPEQVADMPEQVADMPEQFADVPPEQVADASDGAQDPALVQGAAASAGQDMADQASPAPEAPVADPADLADTADQTLSAQEAPGQAVPGQAQDTVQAADVPTGASEARTAAETARPTASAVTAEGVQPAEGAHPGDAAQPTEVLQAAVAAGTQTPAEVQAAAAAHASGDAQVSAPAEPQAAAAVRATADAQESAGAQSPPAAQQPAGAQVPAGAQSPADAEAPLAAQGAIGSADGAAVPEGVAAADEAAPESLPGAVPEGLAPAGAAVVPEGVAAADEAAPESLPGAVPEGLAPADAAAVPEGLQAAGEAVAREAAPTVGAAPTMSTAAAVGPTVPETTASVAPAEPGTDLPGTVPDAPGVVTTVEPVAADAPEPVVSAAEAPHAESAQPVAAAAQDGVAAVGAESADAVAADSAEVGNPAALQAQGPQLAERAPSDADGTAVPAGPQHPSPVPGAQPAAAPAPATASDSATAPAVGLAPAAGPAPAVGPQLLPGAQSTVVPDAAVPVAPAADAEQPLGQFVPVEGQVPTTPHLAPTPPQPLVLPTEGVPMEGLPAAGLPAEGLPSAGLPAESLPTEALPAAGLPTESLPAHGLPAHGQPAEALTAEALPAGAHSAEGAQSVPAAQGIQGVQGPQEQSEPVATVPAPREGEPAVVAAAPEGEPGHDVVQHAEDLETRAADQEESTAAVAEARQSTGPAAPGYADAEREAVLKVMRERRDIRNGFRSDPIPHEVLLRVLEAAHTAPSVGHSQPWDFVVIRSAETRRTMHELAMRQREAYAKSLPKGRAKQFKELKIEAILDTPVNIVVTADPTRGGRHTLGRHTQPQMAPYSSALAVENLWLAARAEGLGVGWVSFFDEREMVRALGLPEHLEVVAYLCVGYVDEFPDEPELMQAGWSKRRPLSWVVHEETYGRRALPGEEPHDLLAETVAQIRPLDAKALGEAWERQKRMTKPAGALGMLEIISAQLSGLSRQCPPPIPEPAAVAIFAGDHGVHAQGVTPWPQEVTAQMVANFLGGGAVCNAFATQVGAEVCVVDVGVAADLPATPGLLPRKIRGGTSDMTTGPAMTREEAKAAIEVGIETARDLVAAGNKALLTGEMGIANTTASAALISVFTGADPAEVTGRGTGINDETLARKTDVVRRALELHQPDPADPIGVLAALGGFEHAAMVGLLLGGASLRTPVILDGVSAGAAALVARAIAPEVLAACIAGHRSAEPGHVAALNKLGLRPLVDLDLRLGEGTGALLALPLVQSTARAMHEVATFDSAGVTEK